MKNIFTFLIIVLHLRISAQTTFQKTYGGTDENYGFDVHPTSDGGYIISGFSSVAAQANMNVIKTNSMGDTLWTKTVQGSAGMSTAQSSDGGYIIAGVIEGVGAGNTDILLVKTDNLGNTNWVKTYGNAMSEKVSSIRQTSDNGYIICGFEEQGVGWGIYDVYLIKTDLNGNLLWTKTYQGGNDDKGLYACETSDGGFVVAGTTNSFDPVGSDIYLIKTDNLGDTQWTKVFYGPLSDQLHSIEPTSDGSFILAGRTTSFVPYNYKASLIKITNAGNLIWAKTYDNGINEIGEYAEETSDGGFILVGYGDTGGGNWDIYLTKTDSFGNYQWSKTYGGIDNEMGMSVKQTSDDGFVLVGHTKSFGFGLNDLYLIKTDALGNSECNQNDVIPAVANVSYDSTWFSATVFSGSITNYQTIPEWSGLNVKSVCISTSMSELFLDQTFVLYPNPFTNTTNLVLNFRLKNGVLKIYDTLGKEIKRKTNISGETIIIDQEDLNPGIYFFKLIDHNNVIAQGKLVIQ